MQVTSLLAYLGNVPRSTRILGEMVNGRNERVDADARCQDNSPVTSTVSFYPSPISSVAGCLLLGGWGCAGGAS